MGRSRPPRKCQCVVLNFILELPHPLGTSASDNPIEVVHGHHLSRYDCTIYVRFFSGGKFHYKFRDARVCIIGGEKEKFTIILGSCCEFPYDFSRERVSRALVIAKVRFAFHGFDEGRKVAE